MMLFNLLIRRAEQPARADKSAVCAINRHPRMVGVVRQCGLLPRFVTFVSLVSLVTVVSGCYKGKIARGEQASRLACSSFSDTKMQSKVTGEERCWHLSVSATLVLARLGNATASLNLSVSPTRLRRYCCAVRRNARHTVRGQPRRKALRRYRFAVSRDARRRIPTTRPLLSRPYATLL